jgi:hypothetical protein
VGDPRPSRRRTCWNRLSLLRPPQHKPSPHLCSSCHPSPSLPLAPFLVAHGGRSALVAPSWPPPPWPSLSSRRTRASTTSPTPSQLALSPCHPTSTPRRPPPWRLRVPLSMSAGRPYVPQPAHVVLTRQLRGKCASTLDVSLPPPLLRSRRWSALLGHRRGGLAALGFCGE